MSKLSSVFIHYNIMVQTLQVDSTKLLNLEVKYLQKGGDAMDTNARLRQLLDERGWTEYKLAKECGLSESTITNIYRRNTVPSISTLEMICKGFGITLSQFFAHGDMVELTPELDEVFKLWVNLKPQQKAALKEMLQAMQNN